MNFLLESLYDLDQQFRQFGGQLYIYRGDPTEIFEQLWQNYNISGIFMEKDCEPIWKSRDIAVENFCNRTGVRFVEKVSHTLWNPNEVINANGGIPPTTYQMFLVILCLPINAIVFK